MLDLEYILENTIHVARFMSGRRVTGTYNEVKKYYEDPELKDIDTVAWEGQPKELQEFYKAYEYANDELGLNLFLIEDFYKEWIKNPSQFIADHLPVISSLSKELVNIKPDADVLIRNYDGFTIGNHIAQSFSDSLDRMNDDFDVIKVTQNQYYEITIQCDEKEKLKELRYISNEIATRYALGD